MTTCFPQSILAPTAPVLTGPDRFCFFAGRLSGISGFTWGSLAHGTRARRDGPICWSNVTISRAELGMEGGGGVVRNTHSQVHTHSYLSQPALLPLRPSCQCSETL